MLSEAREVVLGLFCPGPAFFWFGTVAVQGCELAQEFFLVFSEVQGRFDHDMDDLVATSAAAYVGDTAVA